MLSPSISSLKTPSWLNEFRAIIMRSVVNKISQLMSISPLTSTHENLECRVPPELAIQTVIQWDG
jgi:hypothetical protein